jgi:hypothetical protein
MTKSSPYYNVVYKQQVVSYYINNQPNCSFRSVAKIFNIKGGAKTISRWFNNKDNLEIKPKSGRPRLLSKFVINKYIYDEIKYNNQQSTPIHYNKIKNTINRKLQTNVNLRTIQNYGKQLFNIKSKKTIKRTSDECNYSYKYLF